MGPFTVELLYSFLHPTIFKSCDPINITPFYFWYYSSKWKESVSSKQAEPGKEPTVLNQGFKNSFICESFWLFIRGEYIVELTSAYIHFYIPLTLSYSSKASFVFWWASATIGLSLLNNFVCVSELISTLHIIYPKLALSIKIWFTRVCTF